ncbi:MULTISPECIES: hypothetical protein [Pseudomonas syringae group]|nr:MULTISPECIES: hypothetical protein [Pseudomonas syringae group]
MSGLANHLSGRCFPAGLLSDLTNTENSISQAFAGKIFYDA